MEAKVKLPYDVPVNIYRMLKEDAEKLGKPATRLLIEIIEENHKKLEANIK